ncbi:hypothetical protein PVAP13_5KG020601 [Panicum virgatum]|uniref:GDSL esterase/lipase n=1 Tax=Panicum virgatum TaxID=38727 RepID=A0A8T0S858_PANVG|nr:hypothetical protein PVAP13_5KG020601 [Panicum virgatum]
MIRSLCAAVVLVLLAPWEPAPALAAAAASYSLGPRRRYESIFSLGDVINTWGVIDDSFTDTGNNPAVFAWYSIPDPVTRPPYGTTFFGRPTGRNCDGSLMPSSSTSSVAEALGLPYVPPYLGPPFGSLPASSGGATALDAAFFRSRGILPAPSKFPLNASLSVQLEWFESRWKPPSLCRTTTQECEELLGRSLFFVGEFGVNDYLFSFGKMSLEDIRSVVVPSIIETIRQAIERLIQHGAKTVVVPGVIPLGCSPPVLFLFPEPDPAGYDARTGCMPKHNELGRHHNAALQAALKDRSSAPSTPARLASLVSAYLLDPSTVSSSHGHWFREDGHGRYNYNISVPCGDANATTCGRPSASLYWDGVHFTEAANRHISTTWLSSLIS